MRASTSVASGSKLRAYAELARLSNLPTTLSNVLVGAAAGLSATAVVVVPPARPSLDWGLVAAAWAAIACFYIAGMAMNDLFDTAIDQTERPHRPIPSGRISRREATIFVFTLLIAGLLILAIIGVLPFVAGGILVALIVGYNALHLYLATSVILLGLARGMVYAIAAVATANPTDWSTIEILALTLAAYTTVFSLIARGETDATLGRRRRMAVWLPIIAVIPVVLIPPANWMWMVIPLALALAWISRGIGALFAATPRPRQAVMIWIAGISLLDALYLAILNQPVLAVIALGCFGATTLLHRRIVGT